MRTRDAVWCGVLAVLLVGCLTTAAKPPAASTEAPAAPLKINPTQPSEELPPLVVEIRGDVFLVAGRRIEGGMLSLRGALARERAGTTVAHVKLVEPKPELVDELVRSASTTELKRLVLELESSSIEISLVRDDAATHVVSNTADGRLHLRSTRQAAESDDLATWLPGQPAEEEAARRSLFQQCAPNPCKLKVLPPVQESVPATWSLVDACRSMSAGPSPIQLSFVASGWTEPRTRMGATTVSGRLPPEVIQRVVRHNFDTFRKCYEQGLARDPKLTGRVQVRFVIGRDGKVSNVKDGGSDIPDAAVRDCVLDAFTRLEFPAPEGGIVTVVYPIMLAPG